MPRNSNNEIFPTKLPTDANDIVLALKGYREDRSSEASYLATAEKKLSEGGFTSGDPRLLDDPEIGEEFREAMELVYVSESLNRLTKLAMMMARSHHTRYINNLPTVLQELKRLAMGIGTLGERLIGREKESDVLYANETKSQRRSNGQKSSSERAKLRSEHDSRLEEAMNRAITAHPDRNNTYIADIVCKAMRNSEYPARVGTVRNKVSRIRSSTF